MGIHDIDDNRHNPKEGKGTFRATRREKVKSTLERFAELYEHADYRDIEDLKNRFTGEIIELFITGGKG